MNVENILSKITALLALAENPGASSEEAETAARIAQILMARHQIDAAAVAEARRAEGLHDAPLPIDTAVVGTYKARPAWLGALVATVAKVNGCFAHWCWIRGAYELRVAGPEDDRRLAEQLILLLVAQVERCTRTHAKGKGRTYANSFRHGMVQRLGERLRDAQREAAEAARRESTGSALVFVGHALARRDAQPALVAKWVESQLGKLEAAPSHKVRYDAGAWAEGRKHGNAAALAHDRMAP